ncbi:MAG: transcriptional regulator [Oscillospiraceae bacterium]|nr:transcriptional regulator [Oscillospiraceae bacterium]
MDYAALAVSLDESMSKMRGETKNGRIAALPPGGEMFILSVVVASGDPVSPGELSAVCGVTTARVAMTLNMLEDKGYIIRETDKSDRRRVLVAATESGRAAFQRHDAERRMMLERLLRDLGENDAREYIRIMGRVAEITRRHRSAAPPNRPAPAQAPTPAQPPVQPQAPTQPQAPVQPQAPTPAQPPTQPQAPTQPEAPTQPRRDG